MINSVFIKHNSAYKRILFDDILYVKAIGDYIEIWTKDKRYTIHGTLCDFYKKLHPGKFAYTHRSYIVNLDKITAAESRTNDLTIFLGDTRLKVTRKRRPELLGKLNIA